MTQLDAFYQHIVDDSRHADKRSPLTVEGVEELMRHPAVGPMLANRFRDFEAGWIALADNLARQERQ
jgi:hypothetical protein